MVVLRSNRRFREICKCKIGSLEKLRFWRIKSYSLSRTRLRHSICLTIAFKRFWSSRTRLPGSQLSVLCRFAFDGPVPAVAKTYYACERLDRGVSMQALRRGCS
jgi:hypothetical protein